MGRTDRLPLECAAQFVGRTIRADEADKNDAGPERRHVGGHIGGPAWHDPLLIQSQDRNGCLGRDAVHPSHQVAIDDDVADDRDPRHVHALAHHMSLDVNNPEPTTRPVIPATDPRP